MPAPVIDVPARATRAYPGGIYIRMIYNRPVNELQEDPGLTERSHIRTQVFAHRGFSAEYPENTLIAFQAAVDAGADGIELDVHMAGDGTLVVIHDDRVDRTTNGRGCVAELSVTELKRLQAGAELGTIQADAQIPTLDEVLAWLADQSRPIALNVELKTAAEPYPNLESRTWEAVSSYGLQDRTVFSSFCHESLRTLKRLCPSARIAVLYMEGLVDPWLYARYLHAEGLHPYYQATQPAMIKQAQSEGLSVRVFTVDEEADLQRFVRWGVDAVFTNRPRLARQVVDRWSSHT